MKSIIRNIFLAATFVFTLFSCEKTIEFESEYIEPKIVINSIVRPGRGVLVEVGKSRSVLDENNYFEALTDAKVLLYEDGEFLTELEYTSHVDTFRKYLDYGVIEKYAYERGNYYDTIVVFKAGSTYRLEVSKDGFDPVSCETTIPVPIELNELVVNMEKAFHEYSDNYFEIKMLLTMKDPGDDENFYRLRTYQTRGVELALINYGRGSYDGFYDGGYGQSPYVDLDSIQPTDTIIQQREYNNYLFSTDPVLSSVDALDILDGESMANNFFTDELMNGENCSLSFWTYSYRDVYTDFGEFLEINVVIENISKELYLYYSSREQHGLAIDNPFAEPVPVYSNIEGGLGIFGSESASFIQKVFGDYPLEGKTYIDQNTYNEIYQGWSPY